MGSVYPIKLKDIAKQKLKGRYLDLFTRQIGKVMFIQLEDRVRQVEDGSVIVLDFSNIEAIDYSCADEIFAKLIVRLQQDEYGDKFIILKNLSTHHKENINTVLERKDLAVLAEENKGWIILGSLDNYLFQTLRIIMKEGPISSSKLASRLHLALNTASMRLRNLSKLKLVKKILSATDSGKRCFIYESLLNPNN